MWEIYIMLTMKNKKEKIWKCDIKISFFYFPRILNNHIGKNILLQFIYLCLWLMYQYLNKYTAILVVYWFSIFEILQIWIYIYLFF